MERPVLLTFLMASLVLAPAPAQIPPSYKELKFPPLNRIEVPEPVRFELANGMVVYLLEDRELPLIEAAAMIRTGWRWEPQQKAGLAAIVGTVMRTGGSEKFPGDALDEELDRLGASVETSIGEDSGRASVSVLKEDIDRGLLILADILRNPRFPEDKIELAKIQQRDSIARRNDNPQAILMREFRRLIFGKDSPYARQPEYDTVNSITRADLVAFHREFFQPENVILAVWGDFQAAEMRKKIEQIFGAWPRGGRPKPPVPPVDPAAADRAGLYQIVKDDMPHSWVGMGFLGGRRDDPDYFALEVMNNVLGGGFASRLFNKVRTEQGLAYAVGSNWAAGWDRPGLFVAFGSTKTESTVQILESIRNEIRRLAEGGATQEEVTRAKDSILKGFAFEFDSTGKIAQRLVSYEYYGYPRDYLQRFRDGIEKVTTADVARVAAKYLDTRKLTILVLGKASGFEPPLTALGKVTPVDITIPPPRQAALAEATPEKIAQGREMLRKVREALGGAARLREIEDYTLAADLVLNTPQGQFSMQTETTVSMAGRMLSRMSTPMGEIVQGFDGEAAWMRTPQGVRELPAGQRGEVEKAFFRETLRLLRDPDEPGLTVQSLGEAELEGRKVQALAIGRQPGDFQVRLFVDPATNLLAGKSYTATLMGTPGEVQEVYADWREVEGLKWPHKTVLYRDGQKIGESTLRQVKVNPGVAAEAYRKPK
ncbi:MAG: pitrilysin family protein [Bryobacterales bacterium]|nr:insulinase family protein [Bryobacteraceae bacterium]MDW8131071.1 pitrilysin family protein [Bryobacterales bacterium]